MNKNKKLTVRGIIGLIMVCLILISLSSAIAIDSQSYIEKSSVDPTSIYYEGYPYEGRLRVYVIEPESRWNMYDGNPYHYALLDIAFDEMLSINHMDTYELTFDWTGDITEENVMVLATLFNPEAHSAFAYPPNQNPFNAYYVDATAGAHPGETGYNSVSGNFSHTVLVEEATATWCVYCPNMANALFSIYQSGDYPFYFMALVADKNPDAQTRLNDLNVHAFPTAIFDGGRNVFVGGESNPGPYRTRIESLGKMDVHDLNLTLAVEWLGSGTLEIYINITNFEVIHPPETPNIPYGQTHGYIDVEYTYQANTSDPDGNDVYYMFDWDDGSVSDWLGPYESGHDVIAHHFWTEEGEYAVRVKARDTGGGGYESDWSDPLLVEINPAIFDIEIMAGTSNIIVTITNLGEEDYPEISWNILINGGVFGLIEISDEGIIETIATGQMVTLVSPGKIFGLGIIDITSRIFIPNMIKKTAKGFVFGPFIFIR